MHLRTEADVGEAWGSYVAQTTAHLDMCKKLNLSLIYVATGNQKDIVRFANEAQQVGLSVISKLDLLSSIEEQASFQASAYESLSWDQKAVLDFEILSRSSFFSGPAAVSYLIFFYSMFHLSFFFFHLSTMYLVVNLSSYDGTNK